MKVQRYRDHIAKQHADAQEAQEEDEAPLQLQAVGDFKARLFADIQRSLDFIHCMNTWRYL